MRKLQLLALCGVVAISEQGSVNRLNPGELESEVAFLPKRKQHSKNAQKQHPQVEDELHLR